MGTGLPFPSTIPSSHGPWKLNPFLGGVSPLPTQWGTLSSSIRTFDQITSVPGFRRQSIRSGSPSRFTSSTIPKIPASGLMDRTLPSSAIHIWARSSPRKCVPAMAVVVLPQPLGAAPANQVTRFLSGPSIPVMNICSASSLPRLV